MLGDTTLYKVESGNDKLRLNVVQSLETLLKRHPLTIGTHKQYIRDISSRLADLLTVEDGRPRWRYFGSTGESSVMIGKCSLTASRNI